MSEKTIAAEPMNLSHEMAMEMQRLGRSSTWALIDPAICNPIEQRMKAREVIQIPVRYGDLPPAKRPFLICVGEPGRDALMDDLLHLAEAEALRRAPQGGGPKVRSMCGFLMGAAQPSSLALHLARISVFSFNGQQRLLRLWDPRSLDIFAHLLDEEQKSSLLGSFDAWCWLWRSGGIRVLRKRDDTLRTLNPLHLRAEQVDYLQMSEAINGALDVVQDIGIPLDDACSQGQVGKLIEQGIRKWQLKSTTDQVAYALHAVMMGPDFDAIWPVREAMSLEMERSGEAMRALEKFSD